MEIYLIRHPMPRRPPGFCYGRMEVPVDPQMHAAAAASIRSRIPAEILRRARIFTSPASRCLGLARRLAAPRQPAIDQDLQEMHFGAWEGLSWESVPRVELDAWASDVWSYRAGGGESAVMVAARWRVWAGRVAAGIAERGAPVIAVTHAGLIRVALAGASRLAGELARHVPFASVHRIRMDGADPGDAQAGAP